MTSNKQKSEYNLRNVTVYLPNEFKQQLIFMCELHNITPSALCRKVIISFLNKHNVTKQMIEYALIQIAQQKKQQES